MKANTRAILDECINRGIEGGFNKAHKHTDKPDPDHVFEMIEHYIWLEIDRCFYFTESNYFTQPYPYAANETVED